MQKQMRLLLPEITLKISFEDLLGINCREITEKDRRGRWAKWLKLARLKDKPIAAYWCSTAECMGCDIYTGAGVNCRGYLARLILF